MENKNRLREALVEIKARYFKKTPKSRDLHDKAAKFLPGGDTRLATYFEPYPTYIMRGEGSKVFDIDGNEYLDFLNNYTQQILGHNHLKVKQAIIKQLEFGTIFGSPHVEQIKLAELLCRRTPSFDKIRFCNSGTEATMFAIKGARAYTGKDKIIKIEGMYHGTHDLVEASVFPPLSEAGDAQFPNVVPYNSGIPKNVFQNILVVPWNNQEALEDTVEHNHDDLAAVIMEPIMTAAGIIPATKEYLEFVREITNSMGVVLIFDEVVTFRLATGGAQELYGVTPDLTTVGKFIGGGFPVGAFGGKEEIMSIFSPSADIYSSGVGKVRHSGTFNGHPVIMSAGLATMNELTPIEIKRINSLGDLFREKLNREVFDELKIKAHAKGVGSLSCIHYTLENINDYRDARRASEQAGELPVLVHLELINNGIWIAERGEIALSTPMTEKNVIAAVDAYKKTFTRLRSAIEHDLPQLIKF
jgi:glutamate-1-semialdehyde 2,1-aminomutase